MAVNVIAGSLQSLLGAYGTNNCLLTKGDYAVETGGMKAMIPDGQGTVQLADVAEPAPQANEAVMAVEAYSVNRGETFQMNGPRADWRPGKDVAGRVVAAAADGSGPVVGGGQKGYAGDYGPAINA